MWELLEKGSSKERESKNENSTAIVFFKSLLKQLKEKSIGDQEKTEIPNVSPEQIKNYEYVIQRSAVATRLGELLLYELANNKQRNTVFSKQDLEGRINSLQKNLEHLSAYQHGAIFKKDKTWRVTLISDKKLLTSVEGISINIDGMYKNMLDMYKEKQAENNRLVSTDISNLSNFWIPKSDSVSSVIRDIQHEAQMIRLWYLFTGLSAILQYPDNSGDLKWDLYFTLRNLHELRAVTDGEYAEMIADQVTHDILWNDELFDEELFNTRQPVLRFTKVYIPDTWIEICESSETVTKLVSCEVSKIPVRPKTIIQENKRKKEDDAKRKKEDDAKRINYTTQFEGYEYYYKLTFQTTSGEQVWYYQKFLDIDDGTVKLGNLWADLGNEEVNWLNSWIPSVLSTEQLNITDDGGPSVNIIAQAESTIKDETNMDTWEGLPFGAFTQTTLQEILTNDDITLETLFSFFDDPYAEWSIINMIKDQVQKHWEELWWSYVLENDKLDLISQRMIHEMRNLYDDQHKGKMNIYKNAIETLKNKETKSETKKALLLTKLYPAIDTYNTQIKADQATGDYYADKENPSQNTSLDITLEGKSEKYMKKIDEFVAAKASWSTENIEIENTFTTDEKESLKIISDLITKIDTDGLDEQVNEQITIKTQQYTQEAKLDFCQSVLNGLFEATSKSDNQDLDWSDWSTGHDSSTHIEFSTDFTKWSLAEKYSDLYLYADSMGVWAGDWSDENIAKGIELSKQLALEIAITFAAWGIGGFVARRGLMFLMTRLGAVVEWAEVTTSLAQKFYNYYKYMPTGIKLWSRWFRLLAWTWELAVNSSVFHLSHGLISGTIWWDVTASMKETLKWAWFAKSFVTLGFLKSIGIWTQSVRWLMIDDALKTSMKNKIFSVWFSVWGVGIEAGWFVWVDHVRNTVVGVDPELQKQFDADPKTFLEEYLEAIAFVLGLRAAHWPTNGVTKDKQSTLTQEALQKSTITVKKLGKKLQFEFEIDGAKYTVDKSTEWMLEKQVRGLDVWPEAEPCNKALVGNDLRSLWKINLKI